MKTLEVRGLFTQPSVQADLDTVTVTRNGHTIGEITFQKDVLGISGILRYTSKQGVKKAKRVAEALPACPLDMRPEYVHWLLRDSEWQDLEIEVYGYVHRRPKQTIYFNNASSQTYAVVG